MSSIFLAKNGYWKDGYDFFPQQEVVVLYGGLERKRSFAIISRVKKELKKLDIYFDFATWEDTHDGVDFSFFVLKKDVPAITEKLNKLKQRYKSLWFDFDEGEE